MANNSEQVLAAILEAGNSGTNRELLTTLSGFHGKTNKLISLGHSLKPLFENHQVYENEENRIFGANFPKSDADVPQQDDADQASGFELGDFPTVTVPPLTQDDLNGAVLTIQMIMDPDVDVVKLVFIDKNGIEQAHPLMVLAVALTVYPDKERAGTVRFPATSYDSVVTIRVIKLVDGQEVPYEMGVPEGCFIVVAPA